MEARRWGQVNRGGFSIRSFPGDHFYLTSWLPEVIGETLRPAIDGTPTRHVGYAGP
jgi:surfactin synthase thioesterase subunit